MIWFGLFFPPLRTSQYTKNLIRDILVKGVLRAQTSILHNFNVKTQKSSVNVHRNL